ncbi:hypothetical protein BDDG_01339 [Blastomyces dermatitidis ATCC 18188]|uniref:GRF-type domain-containing protein n=2 Tax=Ajellomyces dermatitidis TaxID=5039 RepID=F2T4H4_AJEDA|nr:hypothetical protein BDDG_01339 [Blastomyces dermatitidis ATCC 18188]EQL37507.1 hypothetical protein BDFG_01101 [Blastomyces dermatitidis ATCC 26199]EQL37508.1 hypothetical protein, variant 1 [Blastomyces dermatitidis ATCC 26199]
MFSRHNNNPPSTPSSRERNSIQPATTPRGFSTPSRSTAIPLRGLFANGTWHCNCEPRRQADHFETKNGGRNHGRWFYTCPKPQGKRCNFFLWEDEAEIRERDMAKVLKGAGTGAAGGRSTNRTPSRPLAQASIDARTGLLTPNTGTRKRARDYEQGYGYGLTSVSEMGSPSKKSRMEDVVVKREEERKDDDTDDDSFGWDEDIEGSVVEQLAPREDSHLEQQRQKQGKGQGIFQPGTRRKSPGWFRDGRGLFVSEDEDEGVRDDGEDGSPHGQRDTDPAGLDGPFFPTPSSRVFRPYHSPSASLSRFSTPQTTRSTLTYGQDTATTSSRTTVVDPFDLDPPQTPTPIRFNSFPLLRRDNQQEPHGTAPPIISSTTTTTSTTSPQKTGTIVSNTLALLSKHNIHMPPAAKRELVGLLNAEYLHTQSIIKGRDATSAAVRNRDVQIQALRGRIELLEAEREGFRLGRRSRDFGEI